jgi:hypothetical protein
MMMQRSGLSPDDNSKPVVKFSGMRPGRIAVEPAYLWRMNATGGFGSRRSIGCVGLRWRSHHARRVCASIGVVGSSKGDGAVYMAPSFCGL